MTITKSRVVGGAAAGVLLAFSMGAAAQAQETVTTWAGAPRFTNDALTFKIRGRVYEDYVMQEVDRAVGTDFSASNSRLRTARIGVEGTYGADWAYKAEVNFPGRGGTPEWEDVMLEYKPNDMTSIMVGNFRTVSLEAITSSRYNTFMERGPFNDVLDASRYLSAQVKFIGHNWTFAAAVAGDSPNTADIANGDERKQVTVRGTFAPIDGDLTKVHIGAWARARNRGDEAGFTYQTRNNTNFGARYVSTGAIADKDTTLAVEGAIVHGPFSVQGEYAQVNVDRIGPGAEPDIKVGYVFGSWFPTGETRRYQANMGDFNRIRILNPTTAGGFGAVELALRYDFADLGSVTGLPTGGEYSSWTAGANWYPIPYVRFMANYTVAENDNLLIANDVKVRTLQFRAQFDF